MDSDVSLLTPNMSRLTVNKKTGRISWITGTCLILFLVLVLVMPAIAVPGHDHNNPNNRASTDNNLSPSVPPNIQKEIDSAIAADISTKDAVEKEITERERRLADHPFSIDDAKSTKIQLTKFVVQKTNTRSSFSDENNNLNDTSEYEIPYGGFIKIGSDGKTRIFSPDGTQHSFSDDLEVKKETTRNRDMMFGNHSIVVPSGSAVRNVGKNVHISYGGKVVLTIIDDRSNDTSNLGSNKEPISHLLVQNNISLPPAAAAGTGSWVAWTKYHPASPIKTFIADWKIPVSPVNQSSVKGYPANIIFNGIQPTSPDSKLEIIQPVTAFNYFTKDAWAGRAMIFGNGCSIYSPSIPLNTEEYVTGIIGYTHSPSNNYWYITLWNRNNVTQTLFDNSTLLLHPDAFSLIDPADVDLYLTYEAYFCEWDGTCRVPANLAKPADIHFESVHVTDSNNNAILPVNWSPMVVAETLKHTGLTGIHIDPSSSYQVFIYTNANSFTIIPEWTSGGSITPSTSQAVSTGNGQIFQIIPDRANNYVIDKIIIDYNWDNPIIPSVNYANKDYSFTNVQNDHSIIATFKPGVIPTCTVTPTVSGTGGTIYPPNPQTVSYGETMTFTITANSNYTIDNILVNGNPQEIVNYTVMNITVTTVTSNSVISATFKPAFPLANFTATPTSGNAPLTVQFNDTSTNTPTSWTWNFGDGNTSIQQNPQHTYVTRGNYTVILTANNAGGSNTITKTDYISVLQRTSIHIITETSGGSLNPFVDVSITGGNPVLTPPVSWWNSQGDSTDMGNYGPLLVDTDTPVTITLTKAGYIPKTIVQTFNYSSQIQYVEIPMTPTRTSIHIITETSSGSLNPYVDVSITGGNPVLTPPVSPFNSQGDSTDMGNYGPLRIDTDTPVTITLTKAGYATATVVQTFNYSSQIQYVEIRMIPSRTSIHIITETSGGSLNPYVDVSITGGNPVLNSPVSWWNSHGMSTVMGNFGPLLIDTNMPITITLTKSGYPTTTIVQTFSYSSPIQYVEIPMTGTLMKSSIGQTQSADTSKLAVTPPNSTALTILLKETKNTTKQNVPVRSQRIILVSPNSTSPKPIHQST